MTSSSYLAAFSLRAAPFSKEIDDDDLWLPESKLALVESVEEALSDRQSAILLGEPGVGKTCVLRALRRRVPEAGYRLTYCRNANLGRRDFYRLLCHTLGLHPSSTAAILFLAVETYVNVSARLHLPEERRHPGASAERSHPG